MSDEYKPKLVPAGVIKEITSNIRDTASFIHYLIEEGFVLRECDHYIGTIFLRNESLIVKIRSPIFFPRKISDWCSVVLVKNYLAVFLNEPSIEAFHSVLGMMSDFPDKSEHYINLIYDKKLGSLIYDCDSSHMIPIIRPHQVYMYSDSGRDIEAIKFSNFDYSKLLVNKVQYRNEICSIPELIAKLEEKSLL